MIDILNEIINEVTGALSYGTSSKVMVSARPELCDFQCNDAFRLAKEYHKSPAIIGEEIVSALKENEKYTFYFREVEFVQPGFINMKVSDAFINQELMKMKKAPKFGIKEPDKKETYFLDYGGYNIAKPLHIGHLRPTIIGESLKRIIGYKGHNTIADVHLGDYGLQMGQVIYGILRDKLSLEEITIDYLNQIYPEISALCKEDESVKEECARITKCLQEEHEEYNRILDKVIEVSIVDAKEICKYLDVSFDLWQGERDSYPYLDVVEKILIEKNLLECSDGAMVVNVKKESDNKPMPPMMFKKSNGGYVYDSTDLATIYERKEKYHPDHTIYVTDFRQNLHFEQVFRVSDMAGLLPYDSLEHAYNGTINGKDGKPFKTRKGDAPKLSELFTLVKETFIGLKEENKNMDEEDIDIIVNAIIKFADFQNGRDKDYIFDPEKFSNVVGKTGPYILYTYLRIEKIIKEEPVSTTLGDKIYNDIDRKLRLKVLELESAFELAFKERKPSYIADYIYSVALLANNFYQRNHIIGLEDKEKRESWVYLLTLVNTIIKEMLDLILIKIPKFM